MKKLIAILYLLSIYLMVSCSSFNKPLCRIQENGLYGFIDTLGNVIITPQYKYVSFFSDEGFSLIISSAQFNQAHDTISIHYGFINKSNELVVDTTNILSIYINDLAIWRMADPDEFVKGFNSKNLDFLASYFNELRLSQGLYPFMDEDTKLLGYKNQKGEIIIRPSFKYASRFINGAAMVSEDLEKFSLISTDGSFIKEKKWDFFLPFSSNGRTWCAEIHKPKNYDDRLSYVWTQIDTKGNILIGPINGIPGSLIFNEYDDIEDLYLYRYHDAFETYYTYIDKNGNFATDKNGDRALTLDGEQSEVFNDALSFSEGLAGVKIFMNNESRWTYMDASFNLATHELYDSVKPFSEGLAVVQQYNPTINHMGNWGVINKSFEVVIPYKFSYISNFSSGVSYARISSSIYDREGWINRKGEFIWETNRKKF